MKTISILSCSLFLITLNCSIASAVVPCEEAGPQTPRDITFSGGNNDTSFPWAPAFTEMNLCNIHTHTQAEHKGRGFWIKVEDKKQGGYACNETSELTKTELTDPFDGKGAYQGVKPGDSIEVHWMHSTCDVQLGPGLGSCVSDGWKNPRSRVEAQVFLLVNDENALDFNDYVNDKNKRNGFYQAKEIPTNTGTPVIFRGSTTGPKYAQETCSPANVTWSVRP